MVNKFNALCAGERLSEIGDSWSLVLCPWYFVLGTLSLVLCPWYFVLGPLTAHHLTISVIVTNLQLFNNMSKQFSTFFSTAAIFT